MVNVTAFNALHFGPSSFGMMAFFKTEEWSILNTFCLRCDGMFGRYFFFGNDSIKSRCQTG
jgi:hypothetical protein